MLFGWSSGDKASQGTRTYTTCLHSSGAVLPPVPGHPRNKIPHGFDCPVLGCNDFAARMKQSAAAAAAQQALLPAHSTKGVSSAAHSVKEPFPKYAMPLRPLY